MEIHPTYQWRKLTPENGIYLFGYYDRNPWNEDQTLHLAMRIPQEKRLPQPGETAEIAALMEHPHPQFVKGSGVPRSPGLSYAEFDGMPNIRGICFPPNSRFFPGRDVIGSAFDVCLSLCCVPNRSPGHSALGVPAS